MLFPGNGFKNRSSFRMGFAYDYRHPFFDDSGLFPGNFRQTVSEELRMVKTDIGDDGKLRRYDVRRV